ncbi:ABC transporter ATP-binding protein [Micromonospora sp. AMSO31t]|uniref:ABC transporter ATP-binding protein n=1 Tax=Micromonospora sp. AMSO31t TaxID=2650566 RepID=UPI00124B430E|nr:ABC transporter ATP-binding protein [Micromonospora sp. AMSO31t]KAB1915620.1 ABC transporter ATP-binding protein [Micromonospora sp. AMSO31t]
MISSALRRLVRPVAPLLVAAVAAQALAAAATVVPLIALASYAAAWLRGTAHAASPTPALVAAASAVASVLLTALAGWLSHRADARLQLLLQRQLIAHLARLPLGSLTSRGAGRIKKTVHDDVGNLHYLVAHTILDVTTVVTAPVAALAYLATLDWRVAAVALAPLIAGVHLFMRAMSGSGANFVRYAQAQSAVNAAIVDYVQGVPVVKAFGRARSAQETFARATDAFHDFFSAWSRSTAAVTTASWLVVTPAVTLALFAAAALLLLAAGWSTPDAVLALALAGPAVAAPVAVVGPRLQAIRTAGSAAAAIVEVLDAQAMSWRTGTRQPADAGVEFDGVQFGYLGGPAVLHSITETLPAGSFTALVGPSGSGKSTFASLLARFHDPTGGAVRIGGVDLRELSEEQLYAHVSFVFQETVLLHGSIRDNLTGGREVGQDDVIRAATAAAIHDRVMRLPRGYDSVVGEDAELSGGEAQRVAIARALLRDTPILVLDEATAATDLATQSTIQRALGVLVRGRTVLVIAHRLRTVTAADQILVLDGGRIVESGTHHELLAAAGRYARMWAAQEPTMEGEPSCSAA